MKYGSWSSAVVVVVVERECERKRKKRRASRENLFCSLPLCIVQSRNNGSCTSPTTTGLQQHHHGHHHQRGGRASGVYGDGSSASQTSSGSSNINSNYNNNSGSAAGGAARPSSLAGGAGGAGGAGVAAAAGMRSKPEAVRRSKSQGAATHRYRDRLVRTLAFNSSLPVHHSADENAQPNAAALSASSSSGAPHYAEYINGSKMTDEQAALPSPLQHCRRNLLLLHRHQSAFTSLGTNVTLANPQKIKYSNKKKMFLHFKQNNNSSKTTVNNLLH